MFGNTLDKNNQVSPSQEGKRTEDENNEVSPDQMGIVDGVKNTEQAVREYMVLAAQYCGGKLDLKKFEEELDRLVQCSNDVYCGDYYGGKSKLDLKKFEKELDGASSLKKNNQVSPSQEGKRTEDENNEVSPEQMEIVGGVNHWNTEEVVKEYMVLAAKYCDGKVDLKEFEEELDGALRLVQYSSDVYCGGKRKLDLKKFEKELDGASSLQKNNQVSLSQEGKRTEDENNKVSPEQVGIVGDVNHWNIEQAVREYMVLAAKYCDGKVDLKKFEEELDGALRLVQCSGGDFGGKRKLDLKKFEKELDGASSLKRSCLS